MKKSKGKVKQAHTSSSKVGMGDFYGTGIKNPVGRVRASYLDIKPKSKKKLGNPPKSLA